MEIRTCPECGKELKGRIDQKFCSPYCRSAYHYKQKKEENTGLFKRIDGQLKKNRAILKKYNLAGKSTVRAETLLEEGFNPGYFTHYWKNNKGAVYLFCYEYGFLSKTENGKRKYILIQWQDYMASGN